MSEATEYEMDDVAEYAVDDVSDALHNIADMGTTLHQFAEAVIEALDKGEITGYGRTS